LNANPRRLTSPRSDHRPPVAPTRG
jgi:hypothetical protein